MKSEIDCGFLPWRGGVAVFGLLTLDRCVTAYWVIDTGKGQPVSKRTFKDDVDVREPTMQAVSLEDETSERV